MSKEEKNKQLRKLRPFKVFAIEKGTVIDHIPASRALTLVKVLRLSKYNKIVTLGLNLKSKKYKFKDLIKIEDKELTQNEFNQVAILVPTATINIIRDFKVIDKFKAVIPKVVNKLITCPNPNCITNNEIAVSKFYPLLISKGQYNFKCHYCEKIFPEKEIINKINSI